MGELKSRGEVALYATELAQQGYTIEKVLKEWAFPPSVIPVVIEEMIAIVEERRLTAEVGPSFLISGNPDLERMKRVAKLRAAGVESMPALFIGCDDYGEFLASPVYLLPCDDPTQNNDLRVAEGSLLEAYEKRRDDQVRQANANAVEKAFGNAFGSGNRVE